MLLLSSSILSRTVKTKKTTASHSNRPYQRQRGDCRQNSWEVLRLGPAIYVKLRVGFWEPQNAVPNPEKLEEKFREALAQGMAKGIGDVKLRLWMPRVSTQSPSSRCPPRLPT